MEEMRMLEDDLLDRVVGGSNTRKKYYCNWILSYSAMYSKKQITVLDLRAKYDKYKSEIIADSALSDDERNYCLSYLESHIGKCL